MECKGCGKDLTGEEYRNVANWPFCMECFERLMDAPAKEEERRIDVRLDVEKGIPSPELETVGGMRCGLCGAGIDSGQEKRLGIWDLCPNCYQALVSAPPDEQGPFERTESDESEAKDHSTEETTEEAPIHLRVQTGFMKSVNCHGCGRRIPAGGSRLVDGRPYCPDCYYVRSMWEDVKAPHPETTESPRSAHFPGKLADAADLGEIGAGVEPRCESCDREVNRESLMRVEGFAICQACLATDPKLALWIARVRHQKRLQRIKSEIQP
jgi:formylmethanofuran dehydrogenase subunit E